MESCYWHDLGDICRSNENSTTKFWEEYESPTTPSHNTGTKNVSQPEQFLFLNSFYCSFFFRTSFFVWIVSACSFVSTLQHITQTSMPPAGLEPPTPASERPQFPDRPACSKSLYRLSYRDPQPLCMR